MDISTFLKDNGFDAEGATRENVAQVFASEIEAKLRGEVSSLRMLPSFIPAAVELSCRAPVVAIDAGGTNLRVASVRLTDQGPEVRHLRRTFMPGLRGTLTAEAFHAAIAAEVNAVLAAEPEADRIGYGFSYECRSLPDRDAELLAWSKSVSVPGVLGQKVGAELRNRLIRPPSSLTVLNDTVATLLAGRALVVSRRYSGYLGLILGTGSNVACVENGKIFNAESGECDKVPFSRFDAEYDATLNDPNHAVFEKLISGAYLGGIGLMVLRDAVAEGLFKTVSAERLSELTTLETRDLDDFASGTPSEGNPLAGLFAGGDLFVARELACALFRRSASLTAAHLAAFLRRAAPSSAKDPVLVTVDGSTFWKTHAIDFAAAVKRELGTFADLPPYEICRVDEASLVGSAVAAASGC